MLKPRNLNPLRNTRLPQQASFKELAHIQAFNLLRDVISPQWHTHDDDAATDLMELITTLYFIIW